MGVKVKTVVVICGPTAVGKTSLSIELAQHFNTEIISADSRQCYKELNIGVAKPSAEELQSTPHYFINSHFIQDDVNAAAFEHYALHAAEKIFKQHDIAVMVGGTGLYIKAFTEGMDAIPLIPEDLRQQIINNYNDKGLEWLQQEVQQHDVEFWRTAEQQNPQRLMRALEVKLATGQSIQTFRKNNKVERPFNITMIGLELPKEQLHHNIHTRVDDMMSEGLLHEVKSLLPYRHINALQTVGYRELFEHLDGNVTLEQAITNIKTNTRQYAKRQMTWFKKSPSITWHTVGDGTLIEIINLINQQTGKI